jgi:alkylresorcinol/alkylpyrone synthase
MTQGAPKILSVGTALPANRVSQQEARALIRAVFQNTSRDLERLLDVFDNGHVKTRYLGAPLEWYFELKSWSERNALYVEVALEISERAALEAMRRAGVTATDLDAIFFVSSTGLATPSLDSWLIKRLGMSRHAVRVPIWGLGCAGGAAGINRAAEYAKAHPNAKVLLIAVELSSLTFQANDPSRANLISTSLFADGAAAVVIAGPEVETQARGLEVLGGSSTLWDDTEDVMGWEVVDTGLKVLLSKSVPLVVEKHIREDVEYALEPLGLTRADIKHYVTHPGGEKVMQAFREALEIPEIALEDSRIVLEGHGNMSSPTVLFALERLMSRLETIQSGQHALLTAMGPGFSAEHAILRIA